MTSVTKPLERPRVCGGVSPGVPDGSGCSAGAVESPDSGTGRRWLGWSRDSMSLRVVGEGLAVVAGVDDRLHNALRALEPVADGGGVIAVGKALRANHDQGRDPVQVHP